MRAKCCPLGCEDVREVERREGENIIDIMTGICVLSQSRVPCGDILRLLHHVVSPVNCFRPFMSCLVPPCLVSNGTTTACTNKPLPHHTGYFGVVTGISIAPAAHWLCVSNVLGKDLTMMSIITHSFVCLARWANVCLELCCGCENRSQNVRTVERRGKR